MVSPYDRLSLGVRCIDGRLWKHVPQFDDPDFEQDIGACEGCAGCDPAADQDENESVFIHMTPRADACEHDFQGWRDFPDGRGGETVCVKCGVGAMAATMWEI